MAEIQLKLVDFEWRDLRTSEGLRKLDSKFLHYLQAIDQLLHDELVAYREGKVFASLQQSQLLIDCGAILEAFIAEFFDIEEAVGALQVATLAHDPIFIFKKEFVLRRARRALKQSKNLQDFYELDQKIEKLCLKNGLNLTDRELAVAHLGVRCLEDETSYAAEIDALVQWCLAAMTTPAGQAAVQGWVSFRLPKKLNYANLVTVEGVPDDSAKRLQGPTSQFRERDGFALTDERMAARQISDEIHYCVYCHKNDGDFCSKGFLVKKNDPSQGLKINPVGEVLTGCPLEEKISEMHVLKKRGYGVAALAMIMIDNPMCPATGHRICNDCMKACIYQKQEPVNIPEIETHILTDVLGLPWGVEIYDLLTRWNPLRQDQWAPKPYNGQKILIMGMGPAGFTLAHHLLMEGCAVLGADGLKIEPIPQELVNQPIYSFESIKEPLDDRVMTGFGGVAEYGITVRWDKNFLKLIYLSLLRRRRFQIFGSVRFGGTLTIEDAWNLGFDHLAIAVGAGLPRELAIPGSLAPGMRQANDFLMALQLTGAAKQSSLANLQVRLPAVVIGGGLTGIDTATEVQAYYIKQVEKTFDRYQKLIKDFGEKTVRSNFSEQDLFVLDEFITHGQMVKTERCNADEQGRAPQFIELIRRWGGVTIVYRRSLQESPAYKRNHEEVEKALEEGIYYAEGLEPYEVVRDQYGEASALTCRWRVMDAEGEWMLTDELEMLPARSIFVATGAKPNIAYEYEHRGSLLRADVGTEYMRYDLVGGQLQPTTTVGHVKMPQFGAFTGYQQDHRRVSFLGDTHPIFHGSVVKAIASAKRTYPIIIESLKDKMKVGDEVEYTEFRAQMEALFRARVQSLTRHNRNIVELKVKAPIAAKNFAPGQFYRIQNYEQLAQKQQQTRLQTEALALMGIQHEDEPDMLSFMIASEGASSDVVACFQPGMLLSVMGPTGASARIASTRTVMIVGGTLAAIQLLSLGHMLKKQGNRVLFVGYFPNREALFCRDAIEQLADAIVWVTQQGELILPNRVQDQAAQGDIITALRQYGLEQDRVTIPLQQVDHVRVIGNSSLIHTIQEARGALLKEFFSHKAEFIASVYGPMQCMLKGVCAECLQWQIDPKTGRRTKAVYACSWQHQPMEIIDLNNISERLGQNRVQEILSRLWMQQIKAKT